MAEIDLGKLSRGDQIVAASGLALFIFSFITWFGVEGGGFSGWHYFLWGVIPTLIGLVMLAQVIISNFTDTELPKLGSFSWGQVHMVLGAVALALIVIKIIIGDDVGGGTFAGFDVDKVDLDRKVGVFLAAIAAAGLAAGGFLKMQAEKGGGAPMGGGPTV